MAVKDPEEVDNSTANGMLGLGGRNKMKILPASKEAERWVTDTRGDRLMALPLVDTIDTSKQISFQSECVFTGMWLLSENTPQKLIFDKASQRLIYYVYLVCTT